MIGIPGESVENMMETVRINASMKPYIVWVSTFIPYSGTELYYESIKKGMIDEAKWHHVDSYRGESVLKEEYLSALEFKKIRVLFRWFLNENLENEAKEMFHANIQDLSSLSNEQWQNGTVERIFKERDDEIDQYLRRRNISHYIRKKYINIFWGSEYDYDLS